MFRVIVLLLALCAMSIDSVPIANNNEATSYKEGGQLEARNEGAANVGHVKHSKHSLHSHHHNLKKNKDEEEQGKKLNAKKTRHGIIHQGKKHIKGKKRNGLHRSFRSNGM